MQLNFQPVRTVIARLVQHHVSIRHKKQPAIPLEKKPVALVNCCSPTTSRPALRKVGAIQSRWVSHHSIIPKFDYLSTL